MAISTPTFKQKQTSLPEQPPKFKQGFFSSLSNRILVAMVVVAFLSAIFSGVLYQKRANDLANVNLEQGRKTFLTRLDNSRLPEAVKLRVTEALELNKPIDTVGSQLVENSLEQAARIVALVACAASVLAFIVGWILTRRIVKPLEKLRLGSQMVAAGNFKQRVPVTGDDEIGQVAYSFNLMTEQLQQVEKRRSELLADVAHELKTPLASIQGHIEALRDNLPRAKADPQAIYDIVLEDVSELDRMVGSLRTWLNAQGLLEKLEIKPQPLAEELPAILERFKPRAEEAQVQLELQLDPQAQEVLADHNALRHILSNLVDNALRYTPKGGKIRLMGWLGEGNNKVANRVTLAVSDTGCGIASEHWPHLFERFYRVDKSRSRDTGGTGLGLSLVKDLVEAQGGRVWLYSQVGQGTTFFISLPSNS